MPLWSERFSVAVSKFKGSIQEELPERENDKKESYRRFPDVACFERKLQKLYGDSCHFDVFRAQGWIPYLLVCKFEERGFGLL